MLVGIVAIVATVIAMTSISLAQSGAEGQVTLETTCGIEVTSGSPMNFGTVATGLTSSEQSVTIYNAGSVITTSLSVSGTDWTSDGNSFDVTNTNVTETSGLSYQPLTKSPAPAVSLINLGNGNSKSIYFVVSIPKGTTQATYTQTITFTSECPAV